MPILDERHDFAHPVEPDTAWSESYYFNAYDPTTDTGLFTRIGVRPHEGTMDVGLSIWLPGSELATIHGVRPQHEMTDSDLAVAGVRYQRLRPARGEGRGNRDQSWGPRRWGGPRMWRWFSINVGDDAHFGGIRIGTEAGDLHRGWVWRDGEATSIRAWDVRTELAADRLTHAVTRVRATDKRGRVRALGGEVLRVAPVAHAVGGRRTLINEGLARWTYEGRTGYGIAEYLHQLDADGRPVVPIE